MSNFQETNSLGNNRVCQSAWSKRTEKRWCEKFRNRTRCKEGDAGNSSVLICREDREIEAGAESLLLARAIPPCAVLLSSPPFTLFRPLLPRSPFAIRSVLSYFLRASFRITNVGNLSEAKSDSGWKPRARNIFSQISQIRLVIGYR